jgi:hypothetical protein
MMVIPLALMVATWVWWREGKQRVELSGPAAV